jgi:hypothetical protein
MEDFEKIIDLNDAYEANLMDEILNDKKIPHGIVPASDSVFGSIEQMEYGWGYLEAPESYRNIILAIYNDIEKK